MSKIAMMEVTVPDSVGEDDIYNFLRRNECRMKLKSLGPNPNDPPTVKNAITIKVVYESKGAEDAARVEDEIALALQSIKSIITAEF